MSIGSYIDQSLNQATQHQTLSARLQPRELSICHTPHPSISSPSAKCWRSWDGSGSVYRSLYIYIVNSIMDGKRYKGCKIVYNARLSAVLSHLAYLSLSSRTRDLIFPDFCSIGCMNFVKVTRVCRGRGPVNGCPTYIDDQWNDDQCWSFLGVVRIYTSCSYMAI